MSRPAIYNLACIENIIVSGGFEEAVGFSGLPRVESPASHSMGEGEGRLGQLGGASLRWHATEPRRRSSLAGGKGGAASATSKYNQNLAFLGVWVLRWREAEKRPDKGETVA